MMRTIVVLLALLIAAPGGLAVRPVRVGDALCVSWSAPPLLALPPAERDAYLAALGGAGWRLLRTDFTWTAIEPSPDRFDFTAYDELVAAARAHDIRLAGILDYGNPWAAPGTPADDDHYPPDDPLRFARFAATTARHYRGRVPAWEVWNEPNFSQFWKPRPDAARYAALAALAARAIHHADAGAMIVTGGLAPTLDFLAYHRDWGFLTAATRAEPDLLSLFDAGALHPYTFLQAPPPEDDTNALGPSVPHQIADFAARLGEAGAARLPIWVTEIGWHTAQDSVFGPGVSETDQARFLVRSVTLAIAAGAERVCWYTGTDYANFLHDKEAAFGLFRYTPGEPPDPKPAFTAAATLSRVLGRARFARDLRAALELPSDAYAFSFRRALQTIIVLWTTSEARVDVPATGTVGLVTMDGTASNLGRPASVALTLGPDPVYLILDQRPR